MLVPQSEPSDTELVSTWQGENFKGGLRLTPVWDYCGHSVLRCVMCPAGGDTRLFNAQAQARDQVNREEEEHSSKMPPYSRLS